MSYTLKIRVEVLIYVHKVGVAYSLNMWRYLTDGILLLYRTNPDNIFVVLQRWSMDLGSCFSLAVTCSDISFYLCHLACLHNRRKVTLTGFQFHCQVIYIHKLVGAKGPPQSRYTGRKSQNSLNINTFCFKVQNLFLLAVSNGFCYNRRDEITVD